MAGAEKPLAVVRPATSADLRQLWEDGHRGPAIRAALEDWEHLMSQPADLDWLVRALRSSGLGAEALVAQLEATRKQTDLPAWEGLIRGVS